MFTPPTEYQSKLKQYREAEGWSQAQLALAIGCHPASISLAERGGLSLGMARRCAAALGCRAADLLPLYPGDGR